MVETERLNQNKRKPQSAGPVKGICTVLVVEDEPGVQSFVRVKLKASGYAVLIASDGVEGLEAVRSQHVDVIVLDLVMPRMGGIEMLRNLRAFSNIPVLITSALEPNLKELQPLGIECEQYLRKPFDLNDLIARIEVVRKKAAPGPPKTVA